MTFENQEFFFQSMKMHYMHYVANMRSGLELSKEMCKSQEIIVMIAGDYTGSINENC